MSERDFDTLPSPKVIGLAAAAGSAVAGIAVALTRRRSAPPPPAGVQTLFADPRVKAAADVVRTSVEQARKRATSPEAQALKSDMKQLVGQAVDTARSELPPLARQAAEAAMIAADRVRSEGAVRSADLGDRFKTDIAPAARALAQEAVSEAEDILAAARERALDFGSTARSDYVPQLGTQTAALGGAAAGVLASVGEVMGQALSDTVKRRALGRRGRGRTTRVADVTGSALQAAGTQLKYVAGETAMIGAWAGALGAVAYFGLLRPSQRKRVRAAFGTVVGQARQLVGDLRATEEDHAPSGE